MSRCIQLTDLPPRPLGIIEGEIKDLEKEIMEMLKEVTA